MAAYFGSNSPIFSARALKFIDLASVSRAENRRDRSFDRSEQTAEDDAEDIPNSFEE